MGDANPYIAELDAALKAAQQQPQAAPPTGQPATTNAPAAPSGQPDYQTELSTALAHPPAAPAPEPFGPPQPDRGWSGGIEDFGANTATGIVKGVGYLGGLPHLAGRLYDSLTGFSPAAVPISADQMPGPPPIQPPSYSPDQPVQPGLLTRNWPSPDQINNAIFSGIDYGREALGKSAEGPYKPTTPLGQVYQAGVSQVIPSLLSGGSTGALERVASGVGAGTTGEVYHQKAPDDPAGQLIATILGGLLTHAVTTSGGQVAQTASTLARPKAAAEEDVASKIATAANQPGSTVASTIAANQPDWTPGTRPDLGNVTESPGVRSMVYEDISRAKRQNDPTYSDNAATTAQAQRTAVAGARPDDAATNLQQAQDDLNTATAAIPPGLSKQEAGEQFRANLQEVKDQREAARGPAGSAFEALKTDQTPVDLTSVKDYATTKAAENAGDYGKAYSAALSQLTSATGITPGTAAFASSARTALNDLASSYGRQGMNAAQKAVLDVRGKLDDYLETAVPAVGEAAAGWKAASQPLDVFDAAPFGKVLAKDQFGRGYVMDNESVVSKFLKSPGSSDALDRLNEIFGNPEASSSALGQYIAGQVKNADGTINPAALAKAQTTYGPALMRFPTLQKQFSTADGATAALNQQQGYQKLYDTVENELGTQTQVGQGANVQNVYSADKFNKFVKANDGMIDQAYTPEQAATVRHVNDELQNIAQTVAQGKAAGTSGTAQLLEKAGEHRTVTGAVLGTLGGSILDGVLKHIGVDIPGVEALTATGGAAIGAAQQKYAAIFDQVRRQALTDPEYAKGLLLKYDPSGVNTPATKRAFEYVLKRTPFATYAGQAQGQ